MDPIPAPYRRSFAPYLVSICAALVHSIYFLPRTVDDLFIFLRYAENLSQGQGLVYNIGEKVEGFSSPLWTVMLATGDRLGFGGVTTAKILGLVSLIALVCAVVHIVYVRLRLTRDAALCAGLLVAVNSYIISWSVLGLETLYISRAWLGVSMVCSSPIRKEKTSSEQA